MVIGVGANSMGESRSFRRRTSPKYSRSFMSDVKAPRVGLAISRALNYYVNRSGWVVAGARMRTSQFMRVTDRR